MQLLDTTTITKPFVPSIWGRLHEPKENYAKSGTWISFLHSFLSSNMPSLRPLASISCHITSIHVFFGLLFALLTCPKLIRSTRRTDTSVAWFEDSSESDMISRVVFNSAGGEMSPRPRSNFLSCFRPSQARPGVDSIDSVETRYRLGQDPIRIGSTRAWPESTGTVHLWLVE